MSWGYKILSAYIIFVLGIGYLVYRTTGERHDLVTPDYYEQELVYQQRIDEVKRTNNLSSPVNCTVSKKVITIEFPTEMESSALKVKSVLYCITDKNKDVEKNWQVDDGSINWQLPDDYSGTFLLKLHFSERNNTYYFERKIEIK